MKRLVLLLLVAACVTMIAVPASAKKLISVTQIVEHPALDAVRQGFQDKLAEKGVEAQYKVYIAQGDQSLAQQIAAQMLGDNPDLVLAIATPTAQAAAQRIKNIPILITAVTDPVAAKLVKSLEKPGKNITGMSDKSPVDRQVELIQEFLPGAKKLGIMYNAGEANSVVLYNFFKAECEKRGIEVVPATVSTSAEVYQAAQSLVGKCDAIYVPTDNTVISAIESAVKVCKINKLPIFAADTDTVNRGAVAALAIDYYEMGRQSGDMGIRILEGADPATMPVEFLHDLKLFVSPAAAKAMGVTIPDAVMKRADTIIE